MIGNVYLKMKITNVIAMELEFGEILVKLSGAGAGDMIV